MSFSVRLRMALEAVDYGLRILLTENKLPECYLDVDAPCSGGEIGALVDLYLRGWNWREIKDMLDTK